jgi:hypothetical protein
MTHLTKSAAIRKATGYVSIAGRGTSYHVYGPYDSGNPRGASTDRTADSYKKARRIRTAWRAKIALALMGRLDADTVYAVDDAMEYPTSAMVGSGVANVVNFVLTHA